MPDQNMTAPASPAPREPFAPPERAIPLDRILNQSDTKAARLTARYEDGQAVETAGSQEIALICTREIIPAGSQAVIPAGTTAVASSDPTDTSTDTSSSSGPEVIIEATTTSHRNRKPLIPTLLGLTAALILVAGICIWQHFNSYEDAASLAEGGLAQKAQDTLFLPWLTHLHDPDFLPYLDARVLLAEGNYDRAQDLLAPLASAGYRDAKELVLEIDYRRGCDAMDRGILTQAIEYLAPLAEQGYRDSWNLYCEARLGYALERLEDLWDFTEVEKSFGYISDAIREGYLPARSIWDEACSTVYDFAVRMYEADDLPGAARYFALLGNYSQSTDYLTLCRTYDYTTTVDELWSLRGFANADEILLTQYYLCEFLIGSWRTSDNGYYYTMEANTNQYAYYCTYNLPWQYTGNFEIVEGVYRVFHNGGGTSLSEFRISIDSWDQITIYCYSNGRYYTLYRK